LYEVIEVNNALHAAILQGSEFEIREAAQAAGWVSMARQAVDLALAGELSVHEAYRTCYFGGE